MLLVCESYRLPGRCQGQTTGGKPAFSRRRATGWQREAARNFWKLWATATSSTLLGVAPSFCSADRKSADGGKSWREKEKEKRRKEKGKKEKERNKMKEKRIVRSSHFSFFFSLVFFSIFLFYHPLFLFCVWGAFFFFITLSTLPHWPLRDLALLLVGLLRQNNPGVFQLLSNAPARPRTFHWRALSCTRRWETARVWTTFYKPSVLAYLLIHLSFLFLFIWLCFILLRYYPSFRIHKIHSNVCLEKKKKRKMKKKENLQTHFHLECAKWIPNEFSDRTSRNPKYNCLKKNLWETENYPGSEG